MFLAEITAPFLFDEIFNMNMRYSAHIHREQRRLDRRFQRPWSRLSREWVVCVLCCFLFSLILSKPINQWILHHISRSWRWKRREEKEFVLASLLRFIYKYERQSLFLSFWPLINRTKRNDLSTTTLNEASFHRGILNSGVKRRRKKETTDITVCSTLSLVVAMKCSCRHSQDHWLIHRYEKNSTRRGRR